MLYLAVSRKPLSISENKLNFDPFGLKERICAISGAFGNSQIPCPNMAILTRGPVSRKPLLIYNVRLFLTLRGWKENIHATPENFANSQISYFMPKYDAICIVGGPGLCCACNQRIYIRAICKYTPFHSLSISSTLSTAMPIH